MDTEHLDEMRDDSGKLPSYAWPGGYQMFYFDRHGAILCPDCANREVDDSQSVQDYSVNYEDPDLYCEDCGNRIPSSYAEGNEGN